MTPLTPSPSLPRVKPLAAALLLAATLALAACGGGGGSASPAGTGATSTSSASTGTAVQAQVQALIEPVSSRCANGGTRIDAWLDANGNGVLDAGEASTTQYVCVGITAAAGATGAAGALVMSSSASPMWRGR